MKAPQDTLLLSLSPEHTPLPTETTSLLSLNQNNSQAQARNQAQDSIGPLRTPTRIMANNHYQMVPLADLPTEWQGSTSAEHLQDAARRLGLPCVEEHKVFLLPQVQFVLEYIAWTYNQPPEGMVGVIVQARETWAAEARPGALKRLKEDLLGGRPGFENLGRAFLPPSTAPSNKGKGRGTGKGL